MSLRTAVYDAVVAKDMVWFDLHLGTGDQQAADDGPVGAGGLMAKFAKSVLFSFHIPHLLTSL